MGAGEIKKNLRWEMRGRVTVHCVPGSTLCDAQIWNILLHIAPAASGFSWLRPENTSRDSGM